MLNLPNKILQRILGALDWFNDHFTSYRLVLYFLLLLLGWTLVGGATNKIAYKPLDILASAGLLVAVCWVTNKAISKFLDIPANNESDLISALILALILTPATSVHDFMVLAAAGLTAMAGKYILVWRRAHVFNPAALGAFVAGYGFSYYASWWVGTKFTVPLVIAGGILILRKMKRFSLALVFLAVYVLALIWSSPTGTTTDTIRHLILISTTSTAVFFFTSIMLDEPLTSPARLNPTLLYALLVGACYSFNRLGLSPEESLLIGNAATFVFAGNRRYKLNFVRKVQEANGIHSYIFSAPKKFKYHAGQYMEWTLAQNKSDSRGNRRYLTISSAPTENELMFTVKVPEKPSAFKQRLESLKPGEPILASYLSGSFTLPDDASQKLAFLAGGVGITPFRSMIKEVMDKGPGRDMALFYAANTQEELAFRDLFTRAQSVGLRNIYTNQITPQLITSRLPDWHERHYFVSGPYGFVQAMEKLLLGAGLPASKITTDYFPGYGG